MKGAAKRESMKVSIEPSVGFRGPRLMVQGLGRVLVGSVGPGSGEFSGCEVAVSAVGSEGTTQAGTGRTATVEVDPV